MKSRILLSMLAGGVLLAGCSKNEESNLLVQDDPTPIVLGTSVDASTKTPVSDGSEITCGIAGWENNSTESYSTAPTWNTTIATTANAATSQTVSWTEQYYYNADEGTTTYMKAWYPAGTLSGTTVTFTNTDGSVDALVAPVVSGTKNNKDGKVVAFSHQTAQINFKVKAGEGLDATTKLRSIKIKSVQLPTGFDLTQTAASAVTYATSSDLTVPGITSDATTITAEATAVGDAVMIKPIEGKTFTIDVETSKATYTDQTVTVTSDNVEAGTAYDVTLTFTQIGIELTATVTAWKTATGSGEIK